MLQIGTTMKRIRKESKQAQIKVANSIGITNAYLCQIESGNRKVSPITLKKFCSYYSMTVTELLLSALGTTESIPDQVIPQVDRIMIEVLDYFIQTPQNQ